jgi:hypothetical protein
MYLRVMHFHVYRARQVLLLNRLVVGLALVLLTVRLCAVLE